jgi:hypothetical protein
MDAEAALFHLSRAQGQREAAALHENRASAIAEAIGASLASSGLEARLDPTGEFR